MIKFQYFLNVYCRYIFLKNDTNIIYKIIFSSVICSLILVTFASLPLRPLNISLILNNLNVMPQENVVAIFARTTWSLIHQLGSIGFDIGLNHSQMSLIFNTFSIIAIIIGINLFVYSFTNSFLLSSISGCFFGANNFLPILEANYPAQLLGSQHLSGIGSNFVFLTIGLLAVNKNGFALFISLLNITIHPFYGIWSVILFCINITINLLQKREIKKKLIIFYYGVLGIILVFISYIFYLQNTLTEKGVVNKKLYSVYLEKWDNHRMADLKWEAILLTFLFILAVLIIRKFIQQKKFKEENPILLTVLISMVFSTFLYFVGEVLPENKLTNIVTSYIFGRFMSFSSILAPMIIFIIIREWFIKDKNLYNKNISNFIFIIGILILLISLNNYIKVIDPKIALRTPLMFLIILIFILPFTNLILNKQNIEKKFYKLFNLSLILLISIFIFFNIFFNKKINLIDDYCPKNLSGKPALVTTTAYQFAQTSCMIPVLLNPGNFDGISYAPWTVEYLARILEIAYGIDFNFPPEKKLGGLSENDYKKTWEDRKKNEWQNIMQELNFSLVFVPKNWNLKLDLISSSNDEFKVYSIN